MAARVVMSTAPSHRARLEHTLARIRDPRGQGSRTFTRVYEDPARAAADAADRLEGLGIETPALAGLPVSIKDLFDVKGEPTTAGSRLLSNAAPAPADAEVVRRLRAAGAAVVGKTNMAEFAFSGLGLNPHYGTPLNPWDRANARIPGGSSSGAAISLTDGMAEAAVGTDTGGSCRIPAALNGLVGMKPSAQTVPLAGALPLSTSYDSIGPLAKTIEMCARLYAVLSGSAPDIRLRGAKYLRIGVIRNYVMEAVDAAVASTYESALTRLSRAGVALVDVSLPVLEELPALFANGGLVSAEAFEWHRELLDSRSAEYDPRVSVRIRRGSVHSAADYIRLKKLRGALISQWLRETESFDAVLMPTVPLVAPMLSELGDDERYSQINLLMLRNPTIVNALDGCAISIPCHFPGDGPVGLTIACANGNDWKLLSIASELRRVL
jgi:aspartyl-tRNA(Asn)/glutamyl-tRNA(Gln) amidotransferase subunit A